MILYTQEKIAQANELTVIEFTFFNYKAMF